MAAVTSDVMTFKFQSSRLNILARRVRPLTCQHQVGDIIRWIGKKTPNEEIRRELPGLYPRLWRFCYSLTNARDRADDLAQSTCTRALAKASSYRPGTHLDRWLFVMARRLWLNEVRAEARRPRLAPVSDLEIPAGAPAPETNILAGQVLEKVAALPEEQRTAVMLVYVEGYRYAEAAEMMEVPIGTIMSRLAAARKKLAAHLADDWKVAGQ